MTTRRALVTRVNRAAALHSPHASEFRNPRSAHLRKTYGDVTAVRDVSLEVESGEVFGIIGAERVWEDYDC